MVERFDEEQEFALTASESEVATRLLNVPLSCVQRSVALVRLENVTLLGNTGRLVDESQGLLLRPRGGSLAVQVNDFRAQATRPVKQPFANYVNLMGEYSGHAHFFHFLFDRLPRIHYLLERFALGRQPLVLLTNGNPPAFQRDIFSFIEARYPNVTFRHVPANERWQLPVVFSIDDYQSSTRATSLSRQTLDFMRSLVLDGYGFRPSAGRRRIYISRADARKRRLKNEKALLPLFEAKGFEPVAAGMLSFRDQVSLFSEASAIAGPHGAGLSHILFAPPGVNVLELFPADKAFNIDYFYLTKAAGGTYDAVIGSKGGRLSWFRADSTDVKTALEKL